MRTNNMRSLLRDVLNENDNTDTTHGERYIIEALGGVVGQHQAQQLGEMFLDYSAYIDRPEAYQGAYKKLYESLGTNALEEGVVKYLQESGLVKNESEGAHFYRGIQALDDIVNYNEDLEILLNNNVLYTEHEVLDLDKSDVLTDAPQAPDRTIEVVDGYSEKEVRELSSYREEVIDGE
jgi:hypothetical protein